ncbi:MAG: DUF4406 domain-containing protein [Eubacteriaceae bacterium]
MKKVERLEKGLCYLAHPCTTHGNIKENKRKEATVARKIMDLYPSIKLLRPLTLLEEDESWEESMIRCSSLIAACDIVIFCNEWKQSKGCKKEFRIAIEEGKIIFFFVKEALYKIEKDPFYKKKYFAETKWSIEDYMNLHEETNEKKAYEIMLREEKYFVDSITLYGNEILASMY